MTTAQKWILKYIRQNFDTKNIQCTLVGSGSIEVTDAAGKTTLLSVNLFGDIMNVKTKEILAVSDAAHDLDKLLQNPKEEPVHWKELKIK